MKRLIVTLILLTILITGCKGTSNDDKIIDQNLPTDVKKYQEQIDELNSKYNGLLEKYNLVNEQLAHQEKLYDLRNELDNSLHIVLRDLIKGDYTLPRESFAKNVVLEDKKIISKMDNSEVEFRVPDRNMNLRQRAYWQEGDKYGSIYEIYDAGYTLTATPPERIDTLNVSYILEDGKWKISSIFIDE